MTKPYYMMPLWKFLLLAIFGGLVIFIVYWSIMYHVDHPLGIFTAKHPLTLHQEIELMTPDHQGPSVARTFAAQDIDSRIREQVLHRSSVKIDHLPNRNMTANVGQYPTMAMATADLAKLEDYINACEEDACRGLDGHLVIRKVDWPGGVTYHLVVERIDDPTFYALCNYMWNGYPERWARQTYHVCSDFDHREEP